LPNRPHFTPTSTYLAPAPRGRGHKNTACPARLNKRDTQYSIRDTALHLSRILYKSPLFLQNEPNFHQAQNKPNPICKKGLRKFYTPSDNEKRTQNEPNSKNAGNRPNPLSNKQLRQKSRVATMKKRTQFKPNFSRPQK